MGLFRIKVRRHSRSWISEKDHLISPQVLELAGKILLSAIRQEIDREWALEAAPSKRKGGLPRTIRFKRSFRCRVVGQEIEILSSWPTVQALIDGKDPYPMTWLTQQAGVKVVPMEGENEEVVFRTTPKFKFKAWKHPGFRQHLFLDRAFTRAKPQMERIVGAGILRMLSSLHPV